ncbi:MAG TPA: OsmC family protein [Fimbriimonadaceae bacterium]|nr:OsmC family protein [Fimbriimonadaceae bacterium]
MKQSKGLAEWQGSLKDGKGVFSVGSGVISGATYTFGTRFGEDKGTNPEELIAAAHAACFSMALSAQLGERGMTPDSIQTTATVTLDKTETGFGITRSHLDVVARIPGADAAQFEEATQAAKKGCPISKVLNTEITMDARLES